MSSTWQTLAISGVHLKLTDKFPPRLTMRKIYNASYFRERDNRYRHEIANHYRDYKLRQPIPHLINTNANGIAAYGNANGAYVSGAAADDDDDDDDDDEYDDVGSVGGNISSSRRHQRRSQRQQMYVRPQRPIGKAKAKATETTSFLYAAAYGDDYDYDNYKIGGNYNANSKQQQQQQQQQLMMIDSNAEMQLETLTVLFDRNYIGGISRYRNELPMHTQYFPSFAKRYSPRGRQTLCEFRPPDETYNDTVRRIQNAHSCEQLKSLVDKQFSWKFQAKQQRERRRQQKQQQQQQEQGFYNKQNQRKAQLVAPLSTSSFQSPLLAFSKESLSQTGKDDSKSEIENFNLLNFERNLKKLKAKRFENHHCDGYKKKPRNRQIDLRKYFQLASDYYENGLIVDLQYLKTIGERNILLKEQQQRQEHAKNENCSGDVLITTKSAAAATSTSSPATSASSSSSLSPPLITEQQQQRETNPLKQNRRRRRFSVTKSVTTSSAAATDLQLKDCRLSNLLQQIKNTHSFRRRKSLCVNWPISVNITRAAGVSSASTVRKIIVNDDSRDEEQGMNDDCLNANCNLQNHSNKISSSSSSAIRNNNNNTTQGLPEQILTTTSASSSASASASSTTGVAISSSSLPYDAIVNDFNQLELTDDFETISLPKIILTDCSSHQQQQQLPLQSTGQQQQHNTNFISGATPITTTTTATINEEALGAVSSPFVSNPNYSSNNNKDQLQQQQQQQHLERLHHQHSEQLEQLGSSRSNFTLRQTKFGNNRSLDIPSESNNYHSEARPP